MVTGIKAADLYGLHRVQPAGVMPYDARRLDTRPKLGRAEALISGRLFLNIDSASFRQIAEVCGHDPKKIGQHILAIVRERGKMHNPVTGSGGMLLGTVTKVGPDFPLGKFGFGVGDRISTLVSLTVTPLQIDKIIEVRPDIERVEIEGHAILSAGGLAAKMPDDLPEPLALAAFDIAGAPAYAKRYVQTGQDVLVIGGGGKSGSFIMAQARENLGDLGRLIGYDVTDRGVSRMKALGYANFIIKGEPKNANDPIRLAESVARILDGSLADLVVNVSNQPGSEMASILSVKDDSRIIFFGMATSFQAAALGAESVGKAVEMMIGTGYLPCHDLLTLEIIRHNPGLRDLLDHVYVQQQPDYLPASDVKYRLMARKPFPIWQKVS